MSTVTASDGVNLELEDLDSVFDWNPDGTLNYVQVTYRGNVYRQTFTYSSGKVVGISRWTKQ